MKNTFNLKDLIIMNVSKSQKVFSVWSYLEKKREITAHQFFDPYMKSRWTVISGIFLNMKLNENTS